MSQSLPKFNSPPVIETVLGVEFETLSHWQLTHFGLFWNQIREEYQNTLVQPPLPEQVEKFGNDVDVLTISLSPHPNYRCWFFDRDNNWLLQVQNNRFLSNWKRKTPSYPNYEGFFTRFDKEWERFKNFVRTEDLGNLEVRQVEVSYINHVDVSTCFDDLHEIFPVWAGFKNKGAVLKEPEAVAFNTVFVIPENKGRLYIVMQPVIRHADIKTVLQLSITAKVKTASNDEVGTAFALAHEWVVKSFVDFTSAKLHKVWGRVS